MKTPTHDVQAVRAVRAWFELERLLEAGGVPWNSSRWGSRPMRDQRFSLKNV